MKEFKDKKEVFEYIKKKYSSADSVLIRGSSVKGLIDFGDIDVEFYQDKPAKPEYELVLAEGKLVLISAYPYKAGKQIKEVPENVLLLKGNYHEQIENQEKYTQSERKLRDNQMLIDMLFKYMRTKDKKYIKSIEKYLKI